MFVRPRSVAATGRPHAEHTTSWPPSLGAVTLVAAPHPPPSSVGSFASVAAPAGGVGTLAEGTYVVWGGGGGDGRTPRY